jgi:hypothetical protein
MDDLAAWIESTVPGGKPEVWDAAGGPTWSAADQEAGEGGELAEGEEPINRGLLLKFLSSVRS